MLLPLWGIKSHLILNDSFSLLSEIHKVLSTILLFPRWGNNLSQSSITLITFKALKGHKQQTTQGTALCNRYT